MRAGGKKGEKTLPVVWPFRGARVGRRSGSHVYTVFFTKCVLISRDKSYSHLSLHSGLESAIWERIWGGGSGFMYILYFSPSLF